MTASTPAAPPRLWRARKRHDHLDAILSPGHSGWELRYVLNRQLLLRRSYTSEAEARMAADATLRELQLVGWTIHW